MGIYFLSFNTSSGLRACVHEALFLQPGMLSCDDSGTRSPITHLQGESRRMNLLAPRPQFRGAGQENHWLGHCWLLGTAAAGSSGLCPQRYAGCPFTPSAFPVYICGVWEKLEALRVPFLSSTCRLAGKYICEASFSGLLTHRFYLLILSSQRWSFFVCLCLLCHLS